ncbi:MAG: SusC/RagA family TonB-linked outer membrane protein [Tenacibaculum sp.]
MKTIILLFILGLTYGLYAQTTVTGTVIAKSDSMPLSGVTVIPNGDTALGTDTDLDGRFKLSLSASVGKLKFSFVGFKSLEVSYRANQDLTIELQEDFTQLNEVVLIGYGQQSKRKLTGAIENADLETTFERGVKGVDEFLQGQLAGVSVINNGGNPTDNPSIIIRGLASPEFNTPLIILDGVPYEGRLNSINPEDIETVSVVKDAAASIYGARATSGVILINTKKGKQGRLSINLNTAVGFKKAYKLLYSLDAASFADIRNLAADNAGVIREPAFDIAQNPLARTTRTNWIDEIFRAGQLTKNNLSISYGNDKIQAFTSLGHFKEEGILLNTQFQRYNYKLNLDYDISDKLKLGMRVNYSYLNANGANTNGAYFGTIFTALSYPTNATVYDPESPSGFGGVGPIEFAGSYGDLKNPVAELLRRDEKYPSTDFFALVNLEYNPFQSFSYKFNISANMFNENYKRFQTKEPEIGRPSIENYLIKRNIKRKRILYEHILEYKPKFENHDIGILLGYSNQKDLNKISQIRGFGFDSEFKEHRYLINAHNIDKDRTFNNAEEKVLISYFSRLSYDYKDKYLFSAILRRDGSSKLVSTNRFGYFSSFLGAWIISNESFFNSNTIGHLKLRGSWGQQGNESVLSAYQIFAILDRIDPIFGDIPSLQTGLVSNRVINTDLRWELSEQGNLGLDIALFSNKLNFSADYYIKDSKDFHIELPLLATSGVSPAKTLINAGKVRNQGYEFSLAYRAIKKDFNFHINANASFNSNEVLEIDSERTFINASDEVRDILRPVRTQVGQPVYAFYGQRVAGIFQSQEEIDNHVGPSGNLLQNKARPGDFKFINTNGDDAIDEKDRVFLGDPYADISYSFTGNFNYKNFDLSLFFQGVADVQAVNALKLTGYNASQQGYNMLEGIKDAWSPSNPSGSIPIVSLSDDNKNFTTFSDFYVEDASYLRLRNITLGYSLPEHIIKKLNLSKLRLYYSIDNLFTLTNYSGFDPEVGIDDRKGIDIGRYPQSRTLLFGINANF